MHSDIGIKSDRSILGTTNSLAEPGLDLMAMRKERLRKVQREMAARNIGSLLLTDIVNIRYTTGVSVMPLWTAVNYAHYVLVPVEGEPVLFEYPQALFRATPFWAEVRPTKYWQSRFVDNEGAAKAKIWASEIADLLKERGLAGHKVGIDNLDYHGFTALQNAGLVLTDADESVEAARVIKLPAEIELMKQAASVTEAALYDFERAIRPGISENELLGVFWHRMLALGGEHCFTRLVASGAKTNPWFYEAGSKLVRPGDLVGIDTDMIGPEGYACDISRTFLCGDQPTKTQIEAYQVAYDFIQGTMELCRPGMAYEDLARRLPPVPEEYLPQRYPVVLHGLGTDDEPPFLNFPDVKGALIPRGELQENQVICVEFYAGKVGEQDGVKLEDQVLVTKDGPVLITHYPYDRKLLGR
jgi:Xaa-Pro aminopeptidase